MRALDLSIAAGITALAGLAVWLQAGSDPVGGALARQPPRMLAIGEPLEDQEVRSASDRPLRLHEVLGRRATVFIAWSVECPCVDIVDDRLLPLIERTKPLGVAFVAVAGDPRDGSARVAEKLMASWSAPKKDGTLRTANGLPPYGVLLDPTQRLCRQLGFREAAQFVIADANGELRFRGTFDDDLKQPTQAWLVAALDDVLAGRAPDVALRPVPGYGCPFGEPAPDCPAEE